MPRYVTDDNTDTQLKSLTQPTNKKVQAKSCFKTVHKSVRRVEAVWEDINKAYNKKRKSGTLSTTLLTCESDPEDTEDLEDPEGSQDFP